MYCKLMLIMFDKKNVVKYNDTNKDIFLTKNGDKIRVVCNVFLKDISNFFKNLRMHLKFQNLI